MSEINSEEMIITENGLFYTNIKGIGRDLVFDKESISYNEELTRIRDNYGINFGEQQSPEGMNFDDLVGVYIVDYNRYLSDKEEKEKKAEKVKKIVIRESDMGGRKHIITEKGMFYSNFDRLKLPLFFLEDSDYYSKDLVAIRDKYGVAMGIQQPDSAGNTHENTVGLYIINYQEYLDDLNPSQEKVQENIPDIGQDWAPRHR